MEAYDHIARYYDLEHGDFVDDIAFYLQYVQQEPVLEVGVGTGRVAQPLLAAGLEVWGIDTSIGMLAAARRRLQHYPRAHLELISAAALDVSTRFGTILMPLNVLWHARDQSDQISTLTALRRHIDKGGTLIIDSSNPLSMADRGAAGEMRRRFHHLDGGIDVLGWSACWDDEARQMLTLSLVYDEAAEDGKVSRSATTLQLRYLYRGELALLLTLTGFRVLHEYGSYDLDPYNAAATNLLVVATTA